MNKISERELADICDGIRRDREHIIKHNPISDDEDEILLWMLLSCLLMYLSLEENEMPCFTGTPDAETYRNAILFVLKDRRKEDFAVEKYLDAMIKND